MMKQLIAGLGVFCFSIVAQALTMSWSSQGTANPTGSMTVKSGQTASFVLAVTVTGNTGSDATIATVASKGQTSTIYNYSSSNGLGANLGFASGNWTANNASTIGSLQLLVLNYSYNDNGNLQVSCYINGVLQTLNGGNASTNLETSSGDLNIALIEAASGQNFTISSAAAYDTELTAEQMAALKTAGDATALASSVPEPTVLALLALGVAGLALKRRV